MTFIKVFYNEAEARKFATLKRGTLTVRIEWDEMTRTIVREFVVKF